MTRTRFAPSPTGLLHVGAARTALFAWLVAHHDDGKFILRIEDTDKQREVSGAEKHIQDSLKWLNITWDESTDIGGPHAPYRQSERLDIYREWAQKLVDRGLAYADPYSVEELEQLRNKAKSQKIPFLYRNHRPEQPPVWDGSQPLRLKSTPDTYQWHDEVMGDMSAGPESIDDFILMKADGYPTYNFCHIVDDALMEVTHVLRSQEFVSSTPRFLNLYRALEITPPKLATLPFVMAMEGSKKLSKRDGAKDLLDYGLDGYLPEAMVNFLATLGWNDGTEQEVFSVDELIEKFRLDRVQTSPARFDPKRLEWLNGQWIRRLTLDDLWGRVEGFWPESASNHDDTYKRSVLALVQDRMRTLADLRELAQPFFTAPDVNLELLQNDKKLKKLEPDEWKTLLEQTATALGALPNDADIEQIQETLNQLLATTEQKPAVLFSLIRYSMTWSPFSPGLAESIHTLGIQQSINRIQSAISAIQ